MRSVSRATSFIFGSGLALAIFLFFGWDLAHHYVPYSPNARSSSAGRFLPLAIWLAAVALRGVGWLYQRQSRSWPSTPATIEGGSVDMVSRNGGWVYVLRAPYSYSVNGERYGGNYTATFKSLFVAECVLKSLRELPPSARYKPGDPSQSAMEPYRDAALAVH